MGIILVNQVKFKSPFMKISTILLPLFIVTLFSFRANCQDKQDEKIQSSIKVLQDFDSMKENIPRELLNVTQGIIVVPRMINAGFVLAGKRGKGIAMVKLEDGSWSNPVFVTITGGSVGFQAGIQSVDLVLIFKSRETLQDIGTGSFTLGGDISVTAGPVGRSSTASTDYKMEAEVYSYSRSKGLFAGISLSGSAISVDAKANEAFYGNDDDSKTLFANTESSDQNVQQLKQVLKSMTE